MRDIIASENPAGWPTFSDYHGGCSPKTALIHRIPVPAFPRKTVVSIHQSIALIRHPDRPEQEWLGVLNDRRPFFSFIVADRLNNESWRECLDRELSWILDLRRGKDYLISHMARLHFAESHFDPQTGEEVESEIEFYIVDPYGRKGRAAFEQLDGVRWLTNDELRQGVTADNRDIDPWLTDLLRRTDLIPKG